MYVRGLVTIYQLSYDRIEVSAPYSQMDTNPKYEYFNVNKMRLMYYTIMYNTFQLYTNFICIPIPPAHSYIQ